MWIHHDLSISAKKNILANRMIVIYNDDAVERYEWRNLRPNVNL